MKQKDDDDDLDDEIECLSDDVECDNMSFKNGSIGSGANTPGSAGSRVSNTSNCHPLHAFFVVVIAWCPEFFVRLSHVV